jgi:nitrogen fixation/metabolism regulation signal transduction histidine kinase
MQVIVNFIKNSSEALERTASVKRKKLIRIKTFANNGCIGFEITDNGIGLDPEEIDHIFDFGKSYKRSSGFDHPDSGFIIVRCLWRITGEP